MTSVTDTIYVESKPFKRGRAKRLFTSMAIGTVIGTLVSSEIVTAVLYTLANLSDNRAKTLQFNLADNVLDYFNYLRTKPLKDVDTIMPWQEVLQAMGYDLGKCGADGMYGTATSQAFADYREHKKLPYTKEWQPLLDALYQDIKASPALQKYLDTVILKPFRRKDVKAFMTSLPQRFSWAADTAAFYRPDILIAQQIDNYFGKGRETLNQEGVAIYGACANNKQIDAYRHGSYLLQMSPYIISTNGAASALLNLRERGGDNEPGILLTDLFNHMKTEEISYNFSVFPWRNPDTRQVIVKAINDGVMATRPFPLVPKAPTP